MQRPVSTALFAGSEASQSLVSAADSANLRLVPEVAAGSIRSGGMFG
jgi:hypothetical protein